MSNATATVMTNVVMNMDLLLARLSYTVAINRWLESTGQMKCKLSIVHTFFTSIA